MSRLRKVVLSMSPLSLIGYIWDSHYDRGMTHLANGRYEQAEEEFLTVEPDNRDHDSCQYALGMCRLYGLGGLMQSEEKGIQLLEKAARAQYSPTIRNKARYLLGKHYAQVEGENQQIFPEDPDSVKDILEELKAHEKMRNEHKDGDSEITKAGLVSGTLAEIYLAGAAINEYLPAQYELGIYYHKKKIFASAQSKQKTKHWLQEAVDRMTYIWSFKESNRLTPEQLDKAQRIIEGKTQNNFP